MAHDPRGDAELLAAAAQGDDAAMATLYLRHRDWCLRVARRYARTDAAAADAVQDAWAWVLARLPRLKLRAKMTTLLFPVVKNCALAASRKRAARVVAQPDEMPADRGGRVRQSDGGLSATSVPQEADARGSGLEDPDRQRLLAALGTLSQPHREALLMRVIDELTIPEIALALGVPEGTIKSRLHHAIRAMKEELRDWGQRGQA
jgi:RNA polymerase sigma-70 factor (ECF subfamily)